MSLKVQLTFNENLSFIKNENFYFFFFMINSNIIRIKQDLHKHLENIFLKDKMYI